MSDQKGFPEIYGKGMLDDQPFIILQKLGLNINELIRRNRKHFSVKTVIAIGISMLGLLEKLHDKGFIHCDIKPDNTMIGDFKIDIKEMNQIYLIDFGIACPYLDSKGNHIPFFENVPFKGNAVFSSKNAFARFTLSRRDDIISLMYLLVYLIDTKLSWVNFDMSIVDQFEGIRDYKINTSAADFLTP